MKDNKFIEEQEKYWNREELSKRRNPDHPVIHDYVVPKINEIKKTININSDTKLLDVGCGNGFFSYYFDKISDTTGIDYSQKMIDINPISQKQVMNAEQIEFNDNTFDIVFCHALLHHVEDMDQVINEMKRVSKKYVVILEPNRNNPLMFLFSLLLKEERKALKFSLKYLKKQLQKNGLKIQAAYSYGMIVPNRTPKFSLPFINLFNFKQPFGMTNILIAQK